MRVFAICIGLAGLAAVSFGVGHHWARQRDPGPAVVAALAEPNELVRAAGLVPVLLPLRRQQLDAVVGAYEASMRRGVVPGSVALELLGEAWATLDPVGGLHRILGWDPAWQEVALPPFLQSWARRDPAAAREAMTVTEIESRQLRRAAVAAVIRGWTDSEDPDLWGGYFAGLPFGKEAFRDLLVGVAAREGVRGVLQRVEALPEGTKEGFRRRAMRQAVAIAAGSDPEEAADFVEQTDSPEAALLASIVARGWVASDAPRAMAWLLAQPPDADRDRTFRSAFDEWLRRDREAALTWASAQTDATLAPALDLYAEAVAQTDPERGTEIAEGIGDPEARRKTLNQIERMGTRTKDGRPDEE